MVERPPYLRPSKELTNKFMKDLSAKLKTIDLAQWRIFPEQLRMLEESSKGYNYEVPNYQFD